MKKLVHTFTVNAVVDGVDFEFVITCDDWLPLPTFGNIVRALKPNARIIRVEGISSLTHE